MGPHDELPHQKAIVTVENVPGRPRVIIEYSDGHTVFLDVAADSLVLRLHLGVADDRETDV